jgi:hypothetical protein
MEQVAAIGHSDNGQSIGRAGGANRRPFERIKSNVDPRAARPDFFADVKHRSFVPLAFANDDRAIDGERIESPAHGVHCSLIRRPFVAAPRESSAAQRGRFRNPHSF